MLFRVTENRLLTQAAGHRNCGWRRKQVQYICTTEKVLSFERGGMFSQRHNATSNKVLRINICKLLQIQTFNPQAQVIQSKLHFWQSRVFKDNEAINHWLYWCWSQQHFGWD